MRENDLRNPISPHNRGIEPSRIEKLHYDAIPMPLPTSAPAGRVVNELDLELRV